MILGRDLFRLPQNMVEFACRLFDEVERISEVIQGLPARIKPKARLAAAHEIQNF
jgi:hypothetical protein